MARLGDVPDLRGAVTGTDDQNSAVPAVGQRGDDVRQALDSHGELGSRQDIEQRRAAGRRRVPLVRLHREQERGPWLGTGSRDRRGLQLADGRGLAAAPRAGTLLERQAGGQRRQAQGKCQAGKDLPEPADPPALPGLFGLFHSDAGVEELLVGHSQQALVPGVRGPFAGRRQPDAAMAERRIATGALPGIRRVGQLLADEQPGAILVDPSTQPRPGTQQRLVGELRPAVVDGDQPSLRQPVAHQRDELALHAGTTVGHLA